MNTNTTPGAFYADVKALLQAQGFTWHTATKETHDSSIMEDLHGKHWYCWCGPEGRWDVEAGPTRDTEEDAVHDALSAYVAFSNSIRESLVDACDGIAHPDPDTGEPDPNEYEGDVEDPGYCEDLAVFQAAEIALKGGATRRHHINPSITDPRGIVIDAIECAYKVLDKISSEVAYGDEIATEPLGKLDDAREAIRMVNL